MMQREKEWIVVLKMKSIEEEVENGDLKEMKGVKVIEGRKG